MPALVSESVNALEHRLLEMGRAITTYENQESQSGEDADSTGARFVLHGPRNQKASEDCAGQVRQWLTALQHADDFDELVRGVRSMTRLLDAEGLLCMHPAAVKSLMERPWRFHPDHPQPHPATVRTIPSKHAVFKAVNSDVQYCLELWACLSSAKLWELGGSLFAIAWTGLDNKVQGTIHEPHRSPCCRFTDWTSQDIRSCARRSCLEHSCCPCTQRTRGGSVQAWFSSTPTGCWVWRTRYYRPGTSCS